MIYTAFFLFVVLFHNREYYHQAFFVVEVLIGCDPYECLLCDLEARVHFATISQNVVSEPPFLL